VICWLRQVIEIESERVENWRLCLALVWAEALLMRPDARGWWRTCPRAWCSSLLRQGLTAVVPVRGGGVRGRGGFGFTTEAKPRAQRVQSVRILLGAFLGALCGEMLGG
jgi:hypothetical protein